MGNSIDVVFCLQVRIRRGSVSNVQDGARAAGVARGAVHAQTHGPRGGVGGDLGARAVWGVHRRRRRGGYLKMSSCVELCRVIIYSDILAGGASRYWRGHALPTTIVTLWLY